MKERISNKQKQRARGTMSRRIVAFVLTFSLLAGAIPALAVQSAIFPMAVLNVSQGVNSGYSHENSLAIDICGAHGGIEDAFAPFTGVIKRIWPNNSLNAIWLESTEKVRFADGTEDYMVVHMMHDWDVSNLYVGKVIQQGEVFYQEGEGGKSPSNLINGNHIHLEVARGTMSGNGWINYQDKKWKIPNQIHPADGLFVDKSRTTIANGKGYNWRDLSAPQPPATGRLEDITSSIYADGITETDATIWAYFNGMKTTNGFGAWLSPDPNNLGNPVNETYGPQHGRIYYNANKWFGTLTPGTTYYYRFYANIGGTHYTSDVYSFKTAGSLAPAAPAIKNLVSYGPKAALAWDAVPGAENYQVYRSVNGEAFALLGSTTLLSILDDGLQVGNTYAYQLQASNAAGAASPMSEARSTLILPAPALTGLKEYGAVATPAVTLSWSAVQNAASYQVFRSINGGEYTFLKGTTGLSINDSGLALGSSYAYRVLSRGTTNNNSALSDPLAITVLGILPTPTIASLKANGSTASMVWSGVKGAVSYFVYRSVNGGTFSFLKECPGTGVTDTGLAVGSTYAYQVMAAGASGNASALSEPKMIQVLQAPALSGLKEYGAPRTPAVTLTWKAVPGASSYLVYRSVNGSAYNFLKGTTGLAINDNAVSLNNTYYYKVAARDAAGSLSAQSNLRGIKVVGVLSAPVITSLKANGNTANLIWGKVSGAVNYMIFRSVNGGAYAFLKESATTGITDTGLAVGSTYAYRVQAVGPAGNTSVQSLSSLVKPLPAPVLSSLKEYGVPSSPAVTLAWKAVPGANSYMVYRSVNGGAFQFFKGTTGLNINDSGLTLGNTYSYKVAARDAAGSLSAQSALRGIKVAGVLSAPVFTSLSNTAQSAYLKWEAVPGATSYAIYRSVNGGAYAFLKGTTGLSITDTGLAYGIQHAYRIQAKADNGVVSPMSASKSVSPSLVLNTPVIASLSNNGTTTATLIWGKVPNAVSYSVYRSVNGGAFQFLKGTTATSIKDAGLTMGSSYAYRVQANGPGNLKSALSSVKSFVLK